MIFPVVMYWCDSWTIKKVESHRKQAVSFWTVVLEKTLEHRLDSKEIKQVSPTGNQPWLFTGREDWCWSWKCQLIGKDPDAGKDWGHEKKMRWLDGITNLMGMNLSKLRERVKERDAWYAAIHGVINSWAWLRNWTTTKNRCAREPLNFNNRQNCKFLT